ncbi:MAG: trypsin-like peptidase domain-containing protein [Methylotenera sp.]|nr:trypsin-like peptidase domain-containing protein [Oligoflexia bacterium]
MSTPLPRLLILLSLATALPLACSRIQTAQHPHHPTPEAQARGSVISTSSLEESVSVMDQGQITCEDLDQCPSAAGMLLSATGDDAGACSAFLISPSIVMTNSHCLPADLKAPHTPAQGRLRMLFPETLADEGQTIEVAEVIDASNLHVSADVLESRDYAFLKLAKESPRKPFTLSRAGVPDGLPLTSVRMTPQSKTVPLGLIQVVQCQAHQKTYFLPRFSNNLSPVVAFSDCDVEHGNSGSALLDPQGNVRAILQSFRSSPIPPMLLQQVDGKAYGMQDGSTKQINSGTNLACVISPLEKQLRILPVECMKDEMKSNLSMETKGLLMELDASRAAALLAELNQWKQDPENAISSQFDWDPVEYEALESRLSLKPVCQKPGARSQNFQLPVWDSSIRLNPYLQFYLKIEKTKVPATLRMSQDQVRLTAQIADDESLTAASSSKVLFDEIIPACAE